jgi:sugar lactone lactonase YvrE
MDVKANDTGVFVAENSQHRVCRFDRNGKKLGTWGTSARTGLDGFGSCCNPMNIAFGPKNVVYTAEDDTGRIKRYSPEGKLLGLVGLVELKPGCKNVSIAVSSDGSHVYMLDITRNHIVRMDPRPADEVAKEEATGKTAQASGTTSSGFGQVLRAIFTSGE